MFCAFHPEKTSLPSVERTYTWGVFFVGYSTSALRSIPLTRMIPSLPRNGKSPINLLYLCTIIVFFKLIFPPVKHSCCTEKKISPSANFNELTTDTYLYLGNKIKIFIVINLRRLNCAKRSQSIGCEANAPKNVCS